MIQFEIIMLISLVVIAQEQNCTDRNFQKNSSWYDNLIMTALEDASKSSEQHSERLEDDLKKFIDDNAIRYDACIGQEEVNDLIDVKYKGIQTKQDPLCAISLAFSLTSSVTVIATVIYMCYKFKRVDRMLKVRTDNVSSYGNSLQCDNIQQQEVTGSRVDLVKNSC